MGRSRARRHSRRATTAQPQGQHSEPELEPIETDPAVDSEEADELAEPDQPELDAEDELDGDDEEQSQEHQPAQRAPLFSTPRWLKPSLPEEPSDEPSPGRPVLTLVLAFVLPPVGAVLGHLSLRRYLNRRKLSRAAIIVGWVLTVVAVMLSLTFFAWRGEQSQVQAYQTQVSKDQQELEKAVEASPSRGKVDRAFCQALTTVADMTPSDGFVRDKSQISPSLVNGFAVMGGMTTPNKDFYAGYAEHLKVFDEHTAQEHTDQALGLRTAMNDDALGCIGLAMDEEKANGTSTAPASPAPTTMK